MHQGRHGFLRETIIWCDWWPVCQQQGAGCRVSEGREQASLQL